MSATIYNYKARNESEYLSLAAYVITLPVQVSLSPGHLTVAIPESAAVDVGDFIRKESLEIDIDVVQADIDDNEKLLADPVTHTSILREIAMSSRTDAKTAADMNRTLMEEKRCLEDEIESANKTRADFERYWRDERKKSERIRNQIWAIQVLLDAIR